MTSFTPRAAALLACSFIVVLVTAPVVAVPIQTPQKASLQAPLRPHPRPPHRANRFFRRAHTERRS